MPTPVATLQTANPSMGTVSRQPQTTGQPASPGSAPFTRLSRQGQILGVAQAGQAFGALWTPTLKPVGGYLRHLILTITATGSTETAATATQDAPWNAIQNLFLRDPFGQPVIQASGFSLYLINRYGGQYGMLGYGNDPAQLPSFQAVNATTGNFNFALKLPFEMDSSGYCSLPSMNAASQPQLQLQFNPTGTVYSTLSGGTAPTITSAVNEAFWMAPVDHPEIAPPDVGSSGQWSEARAQSLIQSAAFQRIQLPRVGTFIHTLILILRDATNLRIEAYPSSDLTLWVDGVPVLFETLQERTDKIYAQFGGQRPTGVIVYTFRDSVQSAVSGADTYDLLLPTTPATLLEISGTWGTISSAPAMLTAVTGELFPVGGIPYTHLGS
jgi:hypothetical protein